MERTIKRPVSLQPSEQKPQPPKLNNFINGLDDGNSVIKAYIKNNYEELPKVDRIDDIVTSNATKKTSQLAEDRLRSMFHKKARSTKEEPTTQASKPQTQASIRPTISDPTHSTSMVEEIVVEEEEYLKDSFEKESQIKESIIKESIVKESIDNRSGIRESIRESIPQQSKVLSMSAIKE